MSIDIYAFLGSNVDELRQRLIDSFERIGFKIALHPDMDLLCSNPTGCMSMAIFETPPTLKRLAPGVPLLTSFGYSITQRDVPIDEADWTPRGVKTHSYELCTRSSSGRSRSIYFMQALTAAILAKETGGYVWFNGEAKALSGNGAFKKVLAELNGLEASVAKLQERLKTLEREHGVAEANRFGRTMHDSLDAAFDIGASPFSTWPPIEHYDRFPWPHPICLPPFQEKRESWWSRISLYWAMVFVVVTLMVLVTFIYS